MEDFFQTVSLSPLFQGMDQLSVKAMLNCLGARRSNYEKGETVMRAGEKASSVGLVLAGRVLLVREDFWGNRTIIGEAGVGELFAEAFACAGAELTVSVSAAEDLTVMWLDIERVVRVCSSACAFHTRLIENLMRVMAGRTLRLTGKMMHMAERTTRAKVLSYLSECSRAADRAAFDITLDRQQLADYLAVDRSALSTQLGKLKREGVLTYDRNHFVLIDPDAMGDA